MNPKTNSGNLFCILFCVLFCVLFALTAPSLTAAQDILLKNADIYTFDRGVLKGYDLLVRNGKIAQIAQDIPADTVTKPGKKAANKAGNKAGNKEDNPKINIIDLKGKSLIPGIIDSHTHIGLQGSGNEMTENVTPEVEIQYHVCPDEYPIYYCLASGVTMIHTMHGSANPIGGQNVVLKLKWGKGAEELVERRAVRSLKMALGENPKRGAKVYPKTRMGISEVIRQSYLEALNYDKQKQEYQRKLKQTPKKERYKLLAPRKNYRLEALLDTIPGKGSDKNAKPMVIRCHSYRAEETLELMRLSKEFGFKIMAFEHIHQAYRIADQLKAQNIGISIFLDAWNYKSEASEFTPYGLKILYQKGVEISLNSDNQPIMLRLHMEAGKIRRYTGMSDLDALKTITLNPARLLGMEAWTGSIEVGKDADLAVFDGHPLSSMSKCVLTLVEGEIYFDYAKDPSMEGKSRKKKKAKPSGAKKKKGGM